MNVKIFDFNSPEITSQNAKVTALYKRALEWPEDEKWTESYVDHMHKIIEEEMVLEFLCSSAQVSFWTHWGASNKERNLDVSLDNRSRG